MKTQYHYITGIAPFSGTPQADGVNILEELIADDDKKLTQNEKLPIEERIIASAVMLGKGCTADEWIEITQEEADEILKQQEEERQRKLSEESNANV